MKNIVLFILSTVCIFFLPSISSAQTITGKTISVSDGDTITILSKSHKQTKIRLYGIDTPERAQAFGNKAKRFTASLVAAYSCTPNIPSSVANNSLSGHMDYSCSF